MSDVTICSGDGPLFGPLVELIVDPIISEFPFLSGWFVSEPVSDQFEREISEVMRFAKATRAEAERIVKFHGAVQGLVWFWSVFNSIESELNRCTGFCGIVVIDQAHASQDDCRKTDRGARFGP